MPEEINDSQYEATLRIINKTIAEIMGNIDSFGDIADSNNLNRMFQSVLQTLNQLGLQVSDVFPQDIVSAYSDGYAQGGAFLNDVMEASAVVGNLQDRVHVEAVQELAVGGVDDMQSAFRTAYQHFVSDISEILRETQDLMAQGVLQGDPTKVITQRVAGKFQSVGLTGFITTDNRRLPLDFYAMTVTRVKVRQAHVTASQKRYEENGVSLVKINVRQPTCHICSARQGLIVSLTGEHAGVPTIDEIGGLPPFHPNCRHYILPVLSLDGEEVRPFIPSYDPRTADQKANYEHEQKIRRKANEEKKQYMRMKAEAEANGQPFPTIGVWRRKKRKNDDSWKALQEAYKQSVANLR